MPTSIACWPWHGALVRGLTAAGFERYDEGELLEVSTVSFVEVEPATTGTLGTVSAELGRSSSDTHRAGCDEARGVYRAPRRLSPSSAMGSPGSRRSASR